MKTSCDLTSSGDHGAARSEQLRRNRHPARGGPIQEVGIPRKSSLAGHLARKPIAGPPSSIPELSHPWIGKDARIPLVACVARQHVKPDCIDLNPKLRIVAEEITLRPTGACATHPSRRGEQQHEAIGTAIPVEG